MQKFVRQRARPKHETEVWARAKGERRKFREKDICGFWVMMEAGKMSFGDASELLISSCEVTV